jgi:two-component system NtrC family sensor kinase
MAQANLVQQERLASIGTLAAGIAHQLNNPVGAILTTAEYATLLLDDLEAGDSTDLSELRETLSRCAFEARRCGDITKSLLQLARGESSARHPNALTTIVSSVVQACGSDVKEREASLRCAWAAEDAEVMADVSPIEIEQALLNIVRNAIQSKPKGAVVVVEMTVSNGIVAICVSDDGRGILPQDQRQLFDPFFSTRINEGGSGLGLPVARRIIEQHGGQIEIDSRPGFGTSVSVRLPMSQASDALPVR